MNNSTTDTSSNSSSRPAITYVVPTLNSAKTLTTTLLSLSQQVGVDITVLVVDSGSVDGTLEICQRWGVKTLYCEPGNMYAAINLGLSTCTTPWMAYLNSDDVLYGDAVARLIACAERAEADLVYGSCDFIDLYGRFMYSFRPPPPHWLKAVRAVGQTTGFAQQATIFRRDLYKRLGGFNTDYRYVADMDFYWRAIDSGARISWLKGAPIAGFRLHDQQFSQAAAALMLTETRTVIQRLGQSPRWRDYGLMGLWKLQNIPNYLLRILRQSILENRLVMYRSMYSGGHLQENIEMPMVDRLPPVTAETRSEVAVDREQSSR